MPGIGSKIDAIWKLRESKRECEAEIKQLEAEINERSNELLEVMSREGLLKATGDRATVSVSELVKPNVEDWESFYSYIRKSNQFHLLERRPSVTGCRELFNTKGKIPGVVPFTMRKVNLRTRKS